MDFTLIRKHDHYQNRYIKMKRKSVMLKKSHRKESFCRLLRSPVAWTLFLFLYCFTSAIHLCQASQIEISLPSKLATLTREIENLSYLIDYQPPRGIPSSGFKLTSNDLKTNANVIIADAAPGADYTINVYPLFPSGTVGTLAWTALYSTEPDPPRELSVDVITGQEVKLDWLAPKEGRVSSYQAKITPLIEHDETLVKNLNVSSNESTLKLRDLTPGATYEVQLQSIYARKPSNAFLSANFTTKPNTPGRFIVWFRNETTLLILWDPPLPTGLFNKYRASINPPDSGLQSEIEIEIDKQESSKSAQAAFYGLVPGRNYNISVQTVSHDQYSQPTEAQYRTVPLPPSNITHDKSIITPGSFEVRWSPPKHTTEFDRYQLSVAAAKIGPKIVPKDDERVAKFDESLEPGRTYEVVVKTVSGNVASWAVNSNVTTAPLPVSDIKTNYGKPGEIYVEWTPNNQSIQDSYMIKYHEVEAFNSDGTVQVVQDKTNAHLINLLAGRNFSITVYAVSHEVLSGPTVAYGVTRPATPIVESKQVLPAISERALNVTWKSDVTSKQDSYKIDLSRNDTRQKKEFVTMDNYYILENLYPGALYNINVSAISYNLISDPYSYSQTVYPKSPENVQIVRATNSTISLTWVPPQNSLVDHYSVKFKTLDSSYWRETNFINSTSTDLKDLEAGERYLIKVVSVSNKVESINLRGIEQTMYPNAVHEIKHILDSYNLTFQWSMPSGRVDYYIIVYNTVREPTIQQSKEVPVNNTRNGQLITAVIDGLIPGELYSFMFYAISNKLRSEGIGLQLRTLPLITSAINVVTDDQATKTLGIKYTPEKLPFYRESWFVITCACLNIVITVIVTALLFVETKSYRYKREASKSNSHDILGDAGFSIDDDPGAHYNNGFGLLGQNGNHRRSNGAISQSTANFTLPKTPPRPHPGSVAYSDDDADDGDDEVFEDVLDKQTKTSGGTTNYDSSGDSLTEKPSEISSSPAPDSDSNDDEYINIANKHFVNHYANVNYTLRGQKAWKKSVRQQQVQGYSSSRMKPKLPHIAVPPIPQVPGDTTSSSRSDTIPVPGTSGVQSLKPRSTTYGELKPHQPETEHPQKNQRPTEQYNCTIDSNNNHNNNANNINDNIIKGAATNGNTEMYQPILGSQQNDLLNGHMMNLNGGRIIVDNMAGSRAPLPGFTSLDAVLK